MSICDKLKIGFDAKRAFCNARGLGNYSRDVVRILSTYFADNQYFLFTPNRRLDFPLSKNCTVVEPRTFFARSFSALWRSRGICSEAYFRNLSLYHGLSHELPLGIERTHIPSVLTVHDILFLSHPELYPYFDRHIFRKKYLNSFHRADRIIAISETTKSELVNALGISPEKVDVVYQGCDPVFSQAISDEKKAETQARYGLPSEFILIVGAIEERKNHQLIMRAMTHKRVALPLVIVGAESRYSAHLKRFASELGIRNRVHFLHHVATEELPAIYALSSVFVFPSLGEGFGRPIIEAFTVGTPVITSAEPSLRETGGDAAVFVSVNDDDELAEAISNVLNDSEMRSGMIARGKQRAKLFSDSSIAESLMNVYSKVL